MVRHPHLTSEHNAASDPARARDPHLGDEDAVRANHGIMADLYEVVDLRPPPDHRLAEGGPIHRDVGADLDVVLHHDPAHLRDLPVAPSIERVSEAVRPEDVAVRLPVDWDSVDPIPDALAELMRRPGTLDVPLDDVAPGEPEHADRRSEVRV